MTIVEPGDLKYELGPDGYIRALRDIILPSGETVALKGELGGKIYSEANLSQDGACWIHTNVFVGVYACVSGNAQVRGTSYIIGRSFITDDANIKGNCIISGDCIVFGDAVIQGKTYLVGSCWIGWGELSLDTDVALSDFKQVPPNATVPMRPGWAPAEHVEVRPHCGHGDHDADQGLC